MLHDMLELSYSKSVKCWTRWHVLTT